MKFDKFIKALENFQLGAYSRTDYSRTDYSRTDYSCTDNGEDVVLEEVETLFPRLFERRNQLAGSLSGGEQQMLVVGRALMCSPKIILLDETTMGLSPQMIEVIVDTLAQLRKKVLHDWGSSKMP